MKYYKFISSIVVFILSIYLTINLKVDAHTTNLGAAGYEGITYDPCIPYSTNLPDAGNSDGETWYGLVSSINGEQVMEHIDNDIDTIYYKIHDTNVNSPNANWTNDPGLYKDFIRTGFDTWNCISIYNTNEEGHLYATRLVNIVDIDTVEDSSGLSPHINVYPVSGGGSVAGGCNPIFESEIISDRQVYNGIKHIHYSQYDIFLHPEVIGRDFDALFSTVSHEMGHVLGLGDLDVIELPLYGEYHHQEVLMGYGDRYGKQRHITYNDLAGVMITRGLHTNDDHSWIYDEESSSEGNHKLICSLCNCVKYVSDLSGYSYEIYKKCIDNCSYEDAHKLESGNMIPVARYLDKDYWKCKYCRYICWFAERAPQQYEYAGICDENTHILENHVEGLEYTLEEPHDFSVELANGIYKCSGCPMCSNGEIYDDNINQYVLECTMSNINNQVTLEANQSQIYRLDINCKNSYLIKATSNSSIVMEIFDSNFQKLSDLPITEENGNVKKFDRLFDEGTYYIRLRFESYSEQGNINFIVTSNDDCYNIPINAGETLSVFEHNHNGHTEFEYYNRRRNFVKITLTATALNGSAIYPEGTITVKNSNGEIIKQFESDIYNYFATTDDGQNCMYLFLESAGYYLIEIEYLPTYASTASICIEDINDLSFNPYNIFENQNLDICSDATSKNDSFYNFETIQNSQYEFNISFDGDADTNDPILFVIIRKDLSASLNPLYSIIYQKEIGPNETHTVKLDLSRKIGYCIGYFGNDINGNVSINLNNYIQSHNATIITDPDSMTNCGTEVTMNGGAYRGNTITQGFTRICYIVNDVQSNSRLDYDWYVSNEEVISVSDYGTVRALNIKTAYTVQVAAVYKYDMSIVITKTFYVDHDYFGYNVTYMYDIILSSSETYLIQSYDTWPSLSRQHYDWVSTDKQVATVNSWGKITPESSGTTTIFGEYIYNNRYIVVIDLTIV